MSTPISFDHFIGHPEEERRRRTRFPLRASCFISWNSRERGITFAAGWTVNLSSEGICLAAESTPKPGEAISVEVALPGNHVRNLFSSRAGGKDAPDVLTACGEGRVVWADVAGSRFAATVCFHLYGRSLCSELALPV